MKKTLMTILISLLIFFLFGSLGLAQEKEQLRKQRREKDVRETIKGDLYSRMKAALDLSAEQEEEIIPRVEEIEMERYRFMEERRMFLQALEGLVSDQRASDAAFLKELARFREMEEKYQRNEEEALNQISTILSPRQRAKFLLFMVDFTKELQNKIDNIRRMQDMEDMRRKRASEQTSPSRDDE